MEKKKSHTKEPAWVKRYNATPVTDTNALKGIAEYNRVLHSLDDKEYALLMNSVLEPEVFHKHLYEMHEKRK